ncbi:outer membrane beta-barrel protein [Mesorhizobium sp. CA18]|uniref:outer membrane beta-barrel protein n=1 Tax=unclassified Mesorhizobium TaxID=325217 RepID=UPI001CCE6749|nr:MULTISPECIES: outer membrane beta-barrel protein [unclassified Mesorhizobium]MBZ9732780.1 outer membrane beta-barrel protein [Mesorhizobium sp. CA9]MBZ9824810.1 outer membrane beta-barrel protein [Mesorhizobium sp. CA18]MBZ9830430.1 outer membrane beta-barrel protein [Mesorhizobium sp. CA2]MBZ9836117.1 outer membrane beta-barrel protein [Mesorhizobium sp. CA3]MBZ9876582.1 outer membrane beta-barrel protein [Mesorhizobium sp. Ca11]
MSGGQSETKIGRSGLALAALLLTASALALLHPAPAFSQETELRGEVSESAILADQQRKARRARGSQGQTPPAAAVQDTASTTYQPSSPGAVPDDDQTAGATDSIFDQPQATDDPLAVTKAPVKPRRPSMAKQRAQDAKAGAKTADKQKAKKKPGETTDSTTTAATAGTGNRTDATATDDNDGSNRRAVTIDSVDKQKLDPGQERTASIEGRKVKPEEDPFAAPGVKVGTFLFRPTLEQGFTATSNADSSSTGKSAVLSETALRFTATSDWRENSALITGYGQFRNTVSGQKINDAQGRIEGQLNVDLDNELRAIAKLGYEAAPESASSPDAIAGVTQQPLRQTVDGSLGLEKSVGKMRYALTGAVSHDFYGDAELSDGITVSQKDRDSTLYTATLRTGYEISPALTPFTEVEAGRRLYDLRVDTDGFERSSTRLGARAGLELDMGEKLSGEFSVGWLREAIDDNRLPAVAGPSIDADLKWSPERGTTIGLTGKTRVETTTTANESGDILYSGRLTGERQIRANLTANSALGLDWRDYTGSDGHDLILSAEAGLTWWLNRYAGVTTRVRTEKLTSNLPGRDYTTNSVYLGLKVQR